jgi:hypothetical protein
MQSGMKVAGVAAVTDENESVYECGVHHGEHGEPDEKPTPPRHERKPIRGTTPAPAAY